MQREVTLVYPYLVNRVIFGNTLVEQKIYSSISASVTGVSLVS